MWDSRTVRLGLGPPGGQPRFVGPAPAKVRGLRGLLAPAAPSDSGSARPAPDQPRSGLTAQSWVRLRPRPAVVLVCSPSVRLGLDPPGSRSSTSWLESSVVGPAPAGEQRVGLVGSRRSVRLGLGLGPALDQSRSSLTAQSWVLLRIESTACEAPFPSDLDTARRSASLSDSHTARHFWLDSSVVDLGPLACGALIFAVWKACARKTPRGTLLPS